jgi:hypothetical protein
MYRLVIRWQTKDGEWYEVERDSLSDAETLARGIGAKDNVSRVEICVRWEVQ